MKPKVLGTIAEARAAIAQARRSGKSTGLVLTMGALHVGHAKLIETARVQCDVVVASIFVNPLQFGPKEDFTRYPRTFEADVELSGRAGADFVFAPDVAEVYPSRSLTFVESPRIGEHLCGVFRPGHFRGVGTVVLKFFNMVPADRAFFGEKDYQQLALIRRMVEDFNIPISIVAVPTVREPDGLAMSSRNAYLSASDRAIAPLLHQALEAVRGSIAGGEPDPRKAKAAGLELLAKEPAIQVEYLEIVDPVEIQPVQTVKRPARIAGAIRIGSTRLIDNIPVT